jgi:hypothetical protein
LSEFGGGVFFEKPINSRTSSDTRRRYILSTGSPKTRGRFWGQREGKILEGADLTFPGVSYLSRFFFSTPDFRPHSPATEALRYRISFFYKRLSG